MAGIRQEGDFRCTIEKQSAWGTPISTAPVGLPTEDLQITMEGDRHIIPVDRGIRFNHEDDRFVDTASSIPVARFSCPITSNLLKVALGGLLQKSTAWAAASSVYTMYPEAPANLPLCRTSSEGYFYTITRRSPTASQSERISDAVLRRLKLSLHPTNNNGLLWGEFEFVGTTYTHSANPSESITQESLSATTRYSWGDLDDVIYDGGADMLNDFISFELDMTFGAKFVGDSVRGEMHFPRFEGTATLVAGQNSITQACEAYRRSQAISTGRPLALKWGDGTVSTAGEMNITLFTHVNTFDDSDRGEGEIHTVTFNLEQGGTASEYPVEFKFYAA